MPADFFVIHSEKLPMAGGIYFIYAMYGLCGKRSIGGTLVDLPIFLDN